MDRARPIPQQRAIWRCPNPNSNLNRRTSLTFRMDFLLAGTLSSFIDGVLMPGDCPASLHLLLLVCGKHSAPSRTPFRQATKTVRLPNGIGVHLQTGMLFGITTESCSASTGIAFTFDRIPHFAIGGVFTPVLAKHSKSFSLVDSLAIGMDRIQRNFEPMRKRVEAWQRSELTDVTAKVVIYEAFIEGKLEAPKHLARSVHDLYFEPKYEEFRPRTIWSLSNAFTSAFKELDPIPQFKATAKLGEFLEDRLSQSF